MDDKAFFEFSDYHVLLAVLGLTVIAARWLPRLISRREPAAAPLMILFGYAVAVMLPGTELMPDPRQSPLLWERVSELAVIVALFGTGMRIDDLTPRALWRPTVRMLGIAMPLTIAAIALLGVSVAGLGAAGAILLGAVLAPTDPVLASDVQVGPPHEGHETSVRFTLTAEAELNDGLAFPFVYLGLLVAASGFGMDRLLVDWFLIDVVYRIGVGAVSGWIGAIALGFVLFRWPRGATLAETGSGVIAIAGVLLCYGSTELIEGYGFISVAVMGMKLRRIEQDHQFHRRLHDFSEAIEHALTAGLLVALGMVMPLLFTDLAWTHVVIALALLLVIRPVAGWIALSRLKMTRADRGIVAVYGVRGIGSIYYLAYAVSHWDFPEEAALWSLVALVILASTLIHGFSVGWAMKRASDPDIPSDETKTA